MNMYVSQAVVPTLF